MSFCLECGKPINEDSLTPFCCSPCEDSYYEGEDDLSCCEDEDDSACYLCGCPLDWDEDEICWDCKDAEDDLYYGEDDECETA